MTAKGNNAAGGTNATTVTIGNSGGASGAAWDLVTIGTGATLIYDNTHIWDSPLAYELATSATSASTFLSWSTSFSDDEIWGTFYAYFTSYATASTTTAAVRIRGGAAVQAARLSWTTTGQIRISDTTTANAVTMTTACPVNAWYRIDYHVKVSTGVSDVWMYKTNPDAPFGVGAHDDHISASGALYGANPVNEFNFGTIANNASVGPYWLANIGVSNIGVPGPPQLWVPTGPRRRTRPPTLPRRTTRLPLQPSTPAPAPPGRSRPRPAQPRRRVATTTPVPVAAPTAPPYVAPPTRKLRPVMRLVRGRTPTTPPPPAAPVPPAYVAPGRPPRPRTASRGRRWATPAPPTPPAPPARPPTRTIRPAGMPGRRPRPPTVISTAVASPTPARPRWRPPPILRNRSKQVAHPQPVAPPAAPPPAPGRIRRAFTWFRHRPLTTVPPAAVQICTVIRPDTGIIGRPDTGTAARPDIGTANRAFTGRVTRPNTGVVNRPGCH